jgi:hypothetical protein
MSSRRKSRNKSIVGNLNDIQKRITILRSTTSTYTASKKSSATQNIALRAFSQM